MAAIESYGSDALQNAHPDNIGSQRRSPQEVARLIGNAVRVFERKYAQALGNGETRQAAILGHAVRQWLDKGKIQWLQQLMMLKRFPVDINTFMNDEDFMGNTADVWPSLQSQLEQMNPDVFTGAEHCNQTLLGGATGIGKTFCSNRTNGYQLYLLTCFDNPQAIFGLNKSTPIVFMMMSVSLTITKRVIYEPFRLDFLSMRYTQKYVEYNARKESALEMANGLHVVPALASIQSLVGQAVIGGILDEVNFMLRIEQSKMVAGNRGLGGLYDQAEEVYYTIIEKRLSRFTSQALHIGNICVISSTRYKGDFLDRRIDEVVEHGFKNVAWFRSKRYDVVPPDRYEGPKFKLLVGTESYPTRVIENDDEELPENAHIEHVPMEHYVQFIQNPDDALRNIVGMATDAISPFIKQRNKVFDCINRGKQQNQSPLTDRDEWDLTLDGFPLWDREALKNILNTPSLRRKMRWAHIDLSERIDSTGVAVIRHDGFVNVPDPDAPGVVNVRPVFTVEAAFAIKPSGNNDIDIEGVRDFVMQLSNFWGISMREITYDRHQSAESMSIIRRAGIRTRNISTVRDMDPYLNLRSMIYDGRLDILPDAELLWKELTQLEYFADKDKVDHPPKGSKDVADAVCSALYAASTSRVIRSYSGQVYQDSGDYITRRVSGAKPDQVRQRHNVR